MGLLNRFFKNRKDVAKEILKDFEFCKSIWASYIANYINKVESVRKLLVSAGSAGKVLIKDQDQILKIIQDIENSIPRDLVNIQGEEKKEQEILKNVKKLTSNAGGRAVYSLREQIIDEEKTITATYGILEKLAENLRAQLHVIKLIKQNPTNEELLWSLYDLVNTQEWAFISFFNGKIRNIKDRERLELIINVLRGEQIAKEVETEKEKLVKKYREIIMDVHSERENEIRGLALSVYEELKKEVDYYNNPDPEEKIRALVYDDVRLTEKIKEFKSKYPKEKLKAFIKAFRYAYEHAVLF